MTPRDRLTAIWSAALKAVDAGKVEDADASDHIPIWVEFVWSS